MVQRSVAELHRGWTSIMLDIVECFPQASWPEERVTITLVASTKTVYHGEHTEIQYTLGSQRSRQNLLQWTRSPSSTGLSISILPKKTSP